MEQHDKKGGLINVAISGVALIFGIALMVTTGSATALAILMLLIVGVLVSAVSLVHMYLSERESLEQLELEEVQRGRDGEALFAEGEVMPARRSREQYEKWAVPVVAVLMLGVQLTGLYLLAFKELPEMFSAIAKDKDVIFMHKGDQYLALIITALTGLILFVRGQFASNFSRIQKQRLLQPASDYVLFGAYLMFLMAAMVAVSFKDQRVDAYVGGVAAVLLGLLALENLLSMIFEIYRPRMAGKRARLLYQSRLVGLIAKPENLFTTAGKVLNYQFGFKVSETWGYQFLRERMGVLIGFQVILLWLSSSLVVVNPAEVGFRYDAFGDGKPMRLEPGLHWKMPWPFASVDRHNPGEVHEIVVGLQPLKEAQDMGQPRLWQFIDGENYDNLRQHEGELYFTSGSVRNGQATVVPSILVSSVPVQYRIKAKEMENSWLQFQNPEQLVENIVYRELTKHFLDRSLEDLLQNQGVEENRKVTERIQLAMDQQQLGVEILFVGLSEIYPPRESPLNIKGKPSEEQAGESAPEGSNLSAEPMAQMVERWLANRVEEKATQMSSARFADTEKLIQAIEEQRIELSKQLELELAETVAKAKHSRLSNEEKPYRMAPEVYRQWRYLESFKKTVKDARKFIIAVGEGTEVQVDLDLQESLRRELYDVKGSNE